MRITPDFSNCPQEVSLADLERLANDIFCGIGDLPDKADEFGESVAEKTESIMESARKRGSGTYPQLHALENMLSGIDKWLNR